MFKSQAYNFIPLKGAQDWVYREYHVQVFPTTFLVGADGRVYFRPHIYDGSKSLPPSWRSRNCSPRGLMGVIGAFGSVGVRQTSRE